MTTPVLLALHLKFFQLLEKDDETFADTKIFELNPKI